MIYIQLIGVLAFAVLVLSFYKKNPKSIIAYQIVSNFAYTVHYFLLGALSGAYISFIGVFRNIAIIKIKNHKKTLAGIVILLYFIITLIYKMILPKNYRIRKIFLILKIRLKL